ncbi:MAG: 23S rRNA (uracil(1939)-C(5))-methyltransferase RlmD [Chitinophagales bacterium]|nr:23S rRNA (uracil(1939)-C(5))-methyltransferase RlmD [Chitinophagales bacterium]MDW8418955.1 23S rRNA (uracil(1939)-C(5))-methyltransferase RlmD [Chitinophagales bacterium]
MLPGTLIRIPPPENKEGNVDYKALSTSLITFTKPATHSASYIRPVAAPDNTKILTGIHITSLSSDGRGVGKMSNGKVVFVEMAVPGDVVDVVLVKDKKTFAEGKIATLHQSSSLRTPHACAHFGVCGGCKWQHIRYEAQLQYKKKIIEDTFRKIGKTELPSVPEVIGSEPHYHYRNKLEFAFTDKRWLTDAEISSGAKFAERNGLGFHVPGNFLGVLDIEECHLQPEPSNSIRLAIREFARQQHYSFFNLKEQRGLLRNLMIRTATTGEVLVLLSFYENDPAAIATLLGFLSEKFPQITSLQYVINPKRNDTIYDLSPIVYKGSSYIVETLGEYKFKIGPKSFFQTNTRQAITLYNVAAEFAALQPGDLVYDLYTGVGSIAIYLSRACARVVGMEYVAEAVADARENAALNGVNNCHFVAGDVGALLQGDFLQRYGKPDVVITDPPRAGMHPDVINALLQAAPRRIVYVSCNAATQARDVEMLSTRYRIARIQPVDMFPHTTHIENVVALEKRE